MAFRIKARESIAKGLRRLARREVTAAYKQVRAGGPSDSAAVHEARKSVKKVRALLDVMESDDARGVSADEKHLRRANRTLSDLRDATAMLEIFDKLMRMRPTLLGREVRAEIRLGLEAHKREAARKVEGRSWREVRRELRHVAHRVGRWRVSHARFGALAPGLQASHRRGRKAMQRALRSQDGEDFHEWRKQIKSLRYALRLIEDRGTAIERDVEVLDEAQALLGDEHNVVILCQYLADVTSRGSEPGDLQRFTQAAERHRRDLQRQALRTARGIYATGSKAYVRGIRDTWKARGRDADQPKQGRARSRQSSAA
jgi:CHAD domain-containing protein